MHFSGPQLGVYEDTLDNVLRELNIMNPRGTKSGQSQFTRKPDFFLLLFSGCHIHTPLFARLASPGVSSYTAKSGEHTYALTELSPLFFASLD